MPVPSRSYQTDAGIDLTAMSVEQKSHGVFLFDSGISIQISDGYYVEIVPRSSIIKTDFHMANSFGVIDPDYRGRILLPFRYIGQGDENHKAHLHTTKYDFNDNLLPIGVNYWVNLVKEYFN